VVSPTELAIDDGQLPEDECDPGGHGTVTVDVDAANELITGA
jgi:hypothetical protein